MSSSTHNDASQQTTTKRVESTSTTKRKSSEEAILQEPIRKEIRTYGKRVKPNAATPPPKRQRVKDQRNTNAKEHLEHLNIPSLVSAPPIKSVTIKSYFKKVPAPSSPRSDRVSSDFSDPIERDLTPPSSPPQLPNRLPLVPLKHAQRPRRRLKTKPFQSFIPKMSFQGDTTPGDGRSGNDTGPSNASPSGNSSVSSGSTSQMSTTSSQLVFDNSLGLASSVECAECGMLYNKTIKAEVSLHTKFHADFFNEKALKSTEATRELVWKHPNAANHKIVCIDKNSSKARKDFARNVLLGTMNDLGGLIPNERTLFSEVDNPDPGAEGKLPRYKVYVYLRSNVSIAVLLAERISEAGFFYKGETRFDEGGPWPSIVPPPEGEETQAFVYADDPERAILLVDRIWVHENNRGQHIATKLIDVARDCHFVPRFAIPRHQVAFSWPTRQGRGFAENYQYGCFGEGGSFLVDFVSPPNLVLDDKLVPTFHSKW
ncbi:hypothetical protein PVAG01_05554 [Phlyctema vagabunda]|uniref:Uncharacterized protein n=1 Tax=Phlyctema vagabunda TaxID=108571 RepID=A0ABR4PKD9_9HELO